MFLKATDSTPEVDLRFAEGKGWIRGPLAHRSGSINHLFENVIDHLTFVLENHQGRAFLIEIEVDEIPSTALPYIRQMLDKLRDFREAGVSVQVVWFYDPDLKLLTGYVKTIANDYYPVVVSKQHKWIA